MDQRENLLLRLSQATETVREKFCGLSAETLSNRADAGSWSIADCIDHITMTSKAYLPILVRASRETYKATFWERYSPFSNSIGKNMIQTLGKNVVRKFKTPRLFQPRKSKDVKPVFDDFFEHQEQIESILTKLESSTFKSRIVTSPVSGLITFSTNDLVQMLVGHQERHLEQALRILVS